MIPIGIWLKNIQNNAILYFFIIKMKQFANKLMNKTTNVEGHQRQRMS